MNRQQQFAANDRTPATGFFLDLIRDTEPPPSLFDQAIRYGGAAGKAHAAIDYALYLLRLGSSDKAVAKLTDARDLLGEVGGWSSLWDTLSPPAPSTGHSPTSDDGAARGVGERG